jgi:hypothetical protein
VNTSEELAEKAATSAIIQVLKHTNSEEVQLKALGSLKAFFEVGEQVLERNLVTFNQSGDVYSAYASRCCTNEGGERLT